jgi:hypothetical protein
VEDIQFMRSVVSIAALVASMVVAGAAQAQTAQAQSGQAQAATGVRPSWEVSAGVDYSTGSYGATVDTQVLYAPLSVRARTDRLRLEASVPYLHIRGPGEFVGGGIVVPGAEATSRSGLGDVLLGGGLTLARGGERAPTVEAAGTIKLPTAGEGLGTGAADLSAQLNLYQPLTPGVMLMASAGYQWLGDADAYDLEDGLIGMVGFNFKPSEPVDAGVTLNYRARAVAGQDAQITASPYAAWRSPQGWGITGYGNLGLTEASPDFGAGLQLSLYR